MRSLKRSVLALPTAMRERLDELAEMVGNVLERNVSRAAVVRAAVTGWLAAHANVDPALVVEEVRAGIVKRGREAPPRSREGKTGYRRSEANVDPSAAKGEVGYVIGEVGAPIGEVGTKLCPNSKA